jgi:hypothetical protein
MHAFMGPPVKARGLSRGPLEDSASKLSSQPPLQLNFWLVWAPLRQHHQIVLLQSGHNSADGNADFCASAT